MKVIIQSGGQYGPANAAARAAFSAGVLKRYITARHKPGQEDITKNIVHLWFPVYLQYALARMPILGNQGIVSLIGDNLFDWMASLLIDRCDIFHGFMGYSLRSMRKAKMLGAKTIMEAGSIHILDQIALFKDEHERFGVPFQMMNENWVNKLVQEYDEADHLVVWSTFSAQSYLNRGHPREQISIVPLGPGQQWNGDRPVLKTGKSFRVLFVGTVYLRKGVQYLLEAMQLLRKSIGAKEAELVLVGVITPEMRPFMRQFAGTFRSYSHVSPEELHRLYMNAEVFVLPSLEDGWGMVVTEAMSCGLPVIVTENTGAKDIVRDGQDGFIVPIRNSEALYNKLLFLYEHESLRKSMGESAREGVKSSSWESYGQQVVDVYSKVLRESRDYGEESS